MSSAAAIAATDALPFCISKCRRYDILWITEKCELIGRHKGNIHRWVRESEAMSPMYGAANRLRQTVEVKWAMSRLW